MNDLDILKNMDEIERTLEGLNHGMSEEGLVDRLDEMERMLDVYNNEKLSYTAENIQTSFSIKVLIDSMNKIHIKFSPDKKKMQKILAKEYINFVKSNQEDEIFETLFKNVNNDEIEKVILFSRYSNTLSASELVRAVKNCDIELKDLIIGYHFLVENKTNLEVDITENIVNGKYKTEESNSGSVTLCNFGETNEYVIKKQIDIVLATIDMIKCIKYGYNNSSISCFDKNGKAKKVFKDKKFCIFSNTYCFVGKNQLTMSDFANFLAQEAASSTEGYTPERARSMYLQYFKVLLVAKLKH